MVELTSDSKWDGGGRAKNTFFFITPYNLQKSPSLSVVPVYRLVNLLSAKRLFILVTCTLNSTTFRSQKADQGYSNNPRNLFVPGRGGGTWVKFWWACAAGFSEPLPHYSLYMYSVASYRPHPSHFRANVIVILRTEFNASRLLDIKTTAGTIFQPRIFLFLNPCLPEFSYPKGPENLRPHSSNSTKNVTLL